MHGASSTDYCLAHMKPVPKKESKREGSVEESKAKRPEESLEKQPVSFPRPPHSSASSTLTILITELQTEDDQGDQMKADQDEGVVDYPPEFRCCAAPSKDDCYGNSTPEWCSLVALVPKRPRKPAGQS
jgi:hypothetical protein